MFIYTLCTKIYMLSFTTEKKSTKVTDIQIVIRLTGWMPYLKLKYMPYIKLKVEVYKICIYCGWVTTYRGIVSTLKCSFLHISELGHVRK